MYLRSVVLLIVLALNIAGCEAKDVEQKTVLPAFENLISQKDLPDPLIMLDGTKVTTAREWREKRRPQIADMFSHYMYGYMPAAPKKIRYDITSIDKNYLAGKGTLKQVAITFDEKDFGPINLLLAIPNNAEPAAVFLGLNFMGNHTAADEPSIHLSTAWMPDRGEGVVNNRPTEASRGTSSGRWPIELAIDRGYAVATFYHGDIDPDKPDYSDGVQSTYYKSGQTKPGQHEWGTIAAWAWGLSRAVDYLVADSDIDSERIAVMGHSRNGKAALLAGAMDERIALVISNQSGCGGAAINRRRVGETVKAINDRFPHWFNAEFKKFNDKEDLLPFDQHMLIAMIAPRPVLIASATGDQWADPEGEFTALIEAGPVYELLGKEKMTADKMPPENTLIGNIQGYHIRPGKHGVSSTDWKVFMDFADKHF